jgi:hypothetical protein
MLIVKLVCRSIELTSLCRPPAPTRHHHILSQVLCAPDAVKPGDDYYVTFEWWSAMKRPLIIHLDLLKADTKEFITGDEVEVRLLTSGGRCCCCIDRSTINQSVNQSIYPSYTHIHSQTCVLTPLHPHTTRPTTQVTGAAGKITTRIVVPEGVHGALKWNAYMSPQNEKWPNALVTTNFDAQIGERTTPPCAPLRNFVRDTKHEPDFNYVVVRAVVCVVGGCPTALRPRMGLGWTGPIWPVIVAPLQPNSAPCHSSLTPAHSHPPQHHHHPNHQPPPVGVQVTNYPTGFKAGAKTEVSVQYNLEPGSADTYVSVAMLKNSDNSLVAHAEAKAEEGEHTAKLQLDVPMEAGTEPVHIVSMLKPAGRAFAERLAEDRVFSTAVYYARKHKSLRG